ncbi:hypothetical protein Q4566_02960 [Tamlana sp. 2_MG-2023]|uniref:hypothetical protein n=1 Tax=unclassified Tamlana TaxID=2614803 RepID=UPI0026E1FF7B|nr:MULTISPECIES: hypothetical protein [unclassified Tamlana]MDO6759147.1 hypothetical protein [Tamlana sp. 2_MG-2023]MDO6789846.1 hypothetical protein [Tamlana sp. 1_MG-2023]
MYIIELPYGTRMDLTEKSDLEKAEGIYNEHKYDIRIDREINNYDFFNEFLKYFSKLDMLSVSPYGDGVSYDFLYKMPNLRRLHLHTMYPINFDKLIELRTLSLWWNKKMITNFDKLQNLEHLSITEFDEKDLTKLSSLTNLKSLSFKTAKIKSLKGIETLTNLKLLSFGGVRSLTDISDITTLQNLKLLEFDICWKLQDFSPINKLKELEVLKLIDCKNLASINFVENMPKLNQLYTLGTTLINDFNTTPAKNIPIYFGSRASSKYNKEYPEKEIEKGQKSWSSYL